MVYGNSVVKLRYYGTMGEVRTSEENINIPFNFLPKNQFEYTLTSGIVQDNEKSRFSRANWNFGLNKKITFWNINFIYTSRTLGNTLIYEKIQKPTFQSYILSSKRVCIFVPI